MSTAKLRQRLLCFMEPGLSCCSAILCCITLFEKIVQLHARLTTSKPPVSSCNGKQPQALSVARWENVVFAGTMSDIPSLLLTFLLV
jgi:hypothetical protein